MSIKETLVIAGLPVHVYRTLSASTKHVVVFFLLHGRYGTTEDVDQIARSVVESSQTGDQGHELFIATFDHRNHGHRLVEPKANNAWNEDPDINNDRHAIDMYGIQTGTARDVSFLIDFLPSYLFPLNERMIVGWGVTGISLGGHSTWIALSQDPRIKTGIPIIGCPDYLALISHRAEKSSLPVGPPYIPKGLFGLIQRSDPASLDYQSLEPSNPFIGKKVLVLSGEKDRLVPWSASKRFVDGLEVGPGGLKRISIHAGVGHECTDKMVAEMAEFIRLESL